MKSPFEFLGIDASADLASIKRAYAQKLRKTRPDEDPAGFQQLHSAYQTACALATQRNATKPAPAIIKRAEPLPAPETASATAASSPANLPVSKVLSFNARASESRADVDRTAEVVAPKNKATTPVVVKPPETTYRSYAHANNLIEPVHVVRPDPQNAELLQHTRLVNVPPPCQRTSSPAPDHVVVKLPVDAPLPVRAPITQVEPAPLLGPQDLAKLILVIATEGDTASLSKWLDERPELWSMRVKQQTGQWIVQAVLREEHTMRDKCLDLILTFFDLNHVLAGIDVNAMWQAKHRMHIRWQSQPSQRNELAGHARDMRTGHASPALTEVWLKMLRGRLTIQHFLIAAWSLNTARNIANFVNYLCNKHLANLPPEFNKQQAEFWLLVGGAAPPNRRRVTVLCIRAMGIAAASLLAWCICIVFFNMADLQTTQESIQTIHVSALLVGGLLGGWILFLTVGLFSEWLSLPEYTPVKRTWLRWSILPALSIAALGVKYLFDAPKLATILAAGLMALSQRRFNRRCGRNVPTVRLYFYFMLIGTCFMSAASAIWSDLTPITEIITAAALIWWSRDAWRHRTQLKQLFTARRKRVPAR